MSDSVPPTAICLKCGGAVSTPFHRPGETPKEPQHIGIPGNPTECP